MTFAEMTRPNHMALPSVRTPSSTPQKGFRFGALKGLVAVGKEVDLTDPADPDWGNALPLISDPCLLR